MTTLCSHPDGCNCDNYREELMTCPDMRVDGNCINCNHAVNLHPRKRTWLGFFYSSLFWRNTYNEQHHEFRNIPDDIPFTKTVCENLPVDDEGCPRSQLVNVADVVGQALKIIKKNITKTNRVPPLQLARLPRGGKTTILKLIFEMLLEKQSEYFPIIVSANGYFALRKNEDPLNGLLRLIAERFIDLSVDANRNMLRCRHEDLLHYIRSVASTRKVVLLIDELNQFGCPLDRMITSFIKSLLDTYNYYVVFSSHVPLDVDVGTSGYLYSPSSRSVESLELPRSNDIVMLRGMQGCGSLTPLQISLYGGIPSLIYTQLTHGQPTVKERFDQKMRQYHATLPLSTTSLDRNRKRTLLQDFVSECMTGNVNSRTPFDCFADYVTKDIRIWPLCYMKHILEYCGRNELLSIETALNVYDGSTESGKDWEMITVANFILVALDAMLNPSSTSISGTSNKRKRSDKSGPLNIAGEDEVTGVQLITIPAEVETFAKLQRYVKKLKVYVGEILILIPTYSKFPVLDGLIGHVKQAQQSDELYVVWKGFQNKLSRKCPTKEVPDWITESVLLRGNAPSSTTGSRLARWTYYTESQLKDMLCYSLRPLYPAEWDSIPTVDGFDDENTLM